MIKRYRKTATVEALQLIEENLDEMSGWVDGRVVLWRGDGELLTAVVTTPEGTLHASPGDYIIKGICGEFYPCAGEIFEASYTEAE